MDRGLFVFGSIVSVLLDSTDTGSFPSLWLGL